MEIIQKIKNHLNEHALHFIEVFNVATEEAMDKALYLNEIREKYGSIDDYFKHILRQGIHALQIQLRKKQGSSSKRIGLSLPLNLSSTDKAPKNIHQSQNGLGYPSQQNTSTIINSSTAALTQELLYKQRIADLEERLIEYKGRLSEKDDEYRTVKRELNDAYDKLRELRVQVATADKEKELALREAAAERKSFFETEFAKECAKGLSGILIPGMARQDNGQSQLSGPELSRTKQNLIHWISSDGINDPCCEILYKVSQQMALYNEEFTPRLIELIKEYESKTN